MSKVAIAYFSGYGHTARVAEHVAAGAKRVAKEVHLVNVASITDQDWAHLDSADAIIFGSPTYMGGVAAQFKTFVDQASGRWFQRSWENKIAAGFTNSGSLSGDKQLTLLQLLTNALQHGMIWVGQSEMAPSLKGDEVARLDAINRVGSYTGLMTQSNNDAPEITPPTGDLKTAELFGERVAKIVTKFHS